MVIILLSTADEVASRLTGLRTGADEYVGKTIAHKYRVEALIGEGGMGKVFRARQLSQHKVVVLKVLRHTLLSDGRTVARFQRESQLTADGVIGARTLLTLYTRGTWPRPRLGAATAAPASASAAGAPGGKS